MLSTTDAIVLSLQPHSDTAHVLHAYTRAGGRVNYRVYGLGRRHPIGLYTPLSLLHITADHSPSRPPTLKEATPIGRPQAVTGAQPASLGIYKQTVALFIGEVLYNVLRHPMQDEPMFDFLMETINELEQTEQPQNSHLSFLVGFAARLGFAINPDEHADLLNLPDTRTERQQQLRRLCAYFHEHVDTWSEPRSLEILMEVFD